VSDHPIAALVRSKVPNPAQPFALVVELQALDGRGDDLVAAIKKCGSIIASRKEAGCAVYDISRDLDSPDHFVVYEIWHDLPALEKHLATPHFNAVAAALDGLLIGAPVVRVLTPIEAP
jgi:quinol monooxygenase YgiN